MTCCVTLASISASKRVSSTGHRYALRVNPSSGNLHPYRIPDFFARAPQYWAIDLLQTAVPQELGARRSGIQGLFGALYPVYVRGEAYLVGHRGAEAAAQFQNVLQHRGIVVSDPVGALAHLQLGRAYAVSGALTMARSAYQDFLGFGKITIATSPS